MFLSQMFQMPLGQKFSGMKSGDVILYFDDKEVEDMKSLPRIVAETEIDKPVNVKVWRNGQLMNLQVIVGEKKDQNFQKGRGALLSPHRAVWHRNPASPSRTRQAATGRPDFPRVLTLL